MKSTAEVIVDGLTPGGKSDAAKPYAWKPGEPVDPPHIERANRAALEEQQRRNGNLANMSLSGPTTYVPPAVPQDERAIAERLAEAHVEHQAARDELGAKKQTLGAVEANITRLSDEHAKKLEQLEEVKSRLAAAARPGGAISIERVAAELEQVERQAKILETSVKATQAARAGAARDVEIAEQRLQNAAVALERVQLEEMRAQIFEAAQKHVARLTDAIAPLLAKYRRAAQYGRSPYGKRTTSMLAPLNLDPGDAIAARIYGLLSSEKHEEG